MKAELTKEEKVKKSLRYSILDGAFFSMKAGLADSFFSPFAIFLRASNLQLSLLSSLPLAVSSILQLFSQKLMHMFKSRMKLIYFSSLLQGFSLIAMILVFMLGRLSVNLMVLFIILYWIFDRIPLPAWNSLMGDLVTEGKRGRYFGKRNRINGASTFLGLLMGAIALGIFGGSDQAKAIGFMTIFSLASLFRFVSVFFLKKMWEPPYITQPRPHFSFFQFLKRGAKSNYSNFVLYKAVMMAAVFIAAPFFAAYMLNVVGLTYVQYTIMMGSSVLAKFISLPLWGYASDRYGTRKVMALSGFLMPFLPILFMLKQDFWYLILIDAYGGFVWGGFDLALFNYIFDSTSPQKRSTCVMYSNFLSGIGILGGSLLGVLILKYNTLFWSHYVLAFVISGVLRLLTSARFIPRLKEIREVEHIPYNKLLLDVLTVKPTMGFVMRAITLPKKRIDKLVKKSKIKPK